MNRKDRSSRAVRGYTKVDSDAMDRKIRARGTSKPSAAFAIVPILSLVFLVYAISLKMAILKPYFLKDITTSVYVMLFGQIILVVVLLTGYSRKEEEESGEVDYLKRKYMDDEEDVGVSVRGKKVEGEELVEVEPEYVEAEVVEDGDEDDGPRGAKAAGPVPKVKVPPQVKVAKPATVMAIPGLKGDWKVFEYPAPEPGAAYSDVMIPVSVRDKVILKHRTLVARACVKCEDQIQCWPKARRVLSKDDFIANTECKDGLRKKGASV